MKRLFGQLSIALAATMLAGPTSAQDTPAEQTQMVRPAKIFTVAETEAVLRRSYPAVVLASDLVEVSFRVSGQVIELPILAAMDVEEGQVLAQIDPRDFERQVARLESQRDQGVAQLAALRTGARVEEIAALEAAVASAQAEVDRAAEQLARSEELVQRDVISEARLEQDAAALKVAEAALQTQQENLAIGNAGGRPEDIEAAEAALRGVETELQIARDNLEDATLRAPFTGVISRRDIDNFTMVQAGQSIALLQALDVVHMSFDVPGPDVILFDEARGQEAISSQVIFDAIPDQAFDAEFVEFSVQADSATQTYRGRVSVTQPGGVRILPGMVGRVVANAPKNEPDLKIPLTSIGADADGSPIVWIVGPDNTVSKRAVVLGEAEGTEIPVTEGLQAGDRIIAAGVSQMLEGLAIRPFTRIGG